MPHKKLIALDFDGVLHSYTTPWTDAATISDGPTPGAMEFLRSLVEDDRFEVVVVSSRCKEPAGIAAIQDWLHYHLMFDGEDAEGPVPRGVDLDDMRAIRAHFPTVQRLFDQIQIVSYRPPAFLTIDDRGWTFEGTWPDLDAMAAFRPWNKRPPQEADSPLGATIYEVTRETYSNADPAKFDVEYKFLGANVQIETQIFAPFVVSDGGVRLLDVPDSPVRQRLIEGLTTGNVTYDLDLVVVQPPGWDPKSMDGREWGDLDILGRGRL